MARITPYQFRRKLEAIQRRIAKHRDALRVEQGNLQDLVDTSNEVEDGLDDACNSLDYAINRLSEQQ